jgi:hypothetical protein
MFRVTLSGEKEKDVIISRVSEEFPLLRLSCEVFCFHLILLIYLSLVSRIELGVLHLLNTYWTASNTPSPLIQCFISIY